MPPIILQPCPFCGLPAEATVTDGEHLVGCGSATDCPVYVVAGPYPTSDEAARAWNRRGGRDDQVPVTQELVTAYENRPGIVTRRA